MEVTVTLVLDVPTQLAWRAPPRLTLRGELAEGVLLQLLTIQQAVAAADPPATGEASRATPAP